MYRCVVHEKKKKVLTTHPPFLDRVGVRDRDRYSFPPFARWVQPNRIDEKEEKRSTQRSQCLFVGKKGRVGNVERVELWRSIPLLLFFLLFPFLSFVLTFTLPLLLSHLHFLIILIHCVHQTISTLTRHQPPYSRAQL